jgi:hypothetical protein
MVSLPCIFHSLEEYMQILLLSKNQSIVACNTQEQVRLIVGGLTMLQRQGEFRARRARPRTSVGASAQMAEFAPALMVFILAVAFPMINLLSFGAGYAALAFLGQQCAVQASNATSYQQALVEMKTQANTIAGSGIGQFAKLAPVGGFQGLRRGPLADRDRYQHQSGQAVWTQHRTDWRSSRSHQQDIRVHSAH